MLHGEKPFGSWRESELDTFAKIAKGQLNIPETFSPEAVDLLTKVSLAYLVISFSFSLLSLSLSLSQLYLVEIFGFFTCLLLF